MARLPIPGGDDGQWGGILNDFLSVEHNADGTHSIPASVQTALDTKVDQSSLAEQVQDVVGAALVAGSNVSLTYDDAAGTIAISSTGGGGPDLSSNATTSSVSIVSSTGADAVIGAASATIAGVMTPADKAALANSVAQSVTVTGSQSIAGGGDLSANRTLSLVNDAATPGNSKYYGTDGSGAKGYFDLPSGVTNLPVGGDISGTTDNVQIIAGAVGTAELADGSVTNTKLSSAVQTTLSGAVQSSRQIIAGTGLSGGGSLAVNRTLNVVNDSTTQRLRIARAGTVVGTRQEVNFIEGANIALTAADNAASNRVDVTIASTGAPDATTTSKGTIQLAGDLGGIATAPTVPGLAVKLNASEKGSADGVASLDSGGKVPLSQLPAMSMVQVLPYSHTGNLFVMTGGFRLYNDTTAAWAIQSVRVSVGTAPANAAIIIDINKNGTTLFTTQANRPTIAVGANTSGKVTNMDVTSVAIGEYLTIDIDQTGTVTPGADLTVQVEVT